jgi:uncharacterized protein YbaP (TraB family)
MSKLSERYVECLEQLCKLRVELAEKTATVLQQAEDPILDEMDRIWDRLSSKEQQDLEKEAERAWPKDLP